MTRAMTILIVGVLLAAMALPAGVDVSFCQTMHTFHLLDRCQACARAEQAPAKKMACCRGNATEAIVHTPSPAPVSESIGCCDRHSLPARISCLVDTSQLIKQLSVVTVPVDAVHMLPPPPASPALAVDEVHCRPPPDPLYLVNCVLLV